MTTCPKCGAAAWKVVEEREPPFSYFDCGSSLDGELHTQSDRCRIAELTATVARLLRGDFTPDELFANTRDKINRLRAAGDGLAGALMETSDGSAVSAARSEKLAAAREWLARREHPG
jgi:hypothetical protein